MLTFRQAVGGAWAGSPTAWLALLLPATLVVVLQESATDFAGWPVVLVLALTEHIAAGAVIGVVVVLARKRWAILPLAVLVPTWIVAGAVRGVVWAALVSTIGDDGALVNYRIATWVGISVLWIPLLTYALAQIDHRRVMLSQLEAARRERVVERARSELSERTRRSELMEAVHSTISPVIREIHRSLGTIAAGVDRSTLVSMSARLGVVAFDAARLMAPNQASETPTRSRAERAPVGASFDFPHNRPLLTAGLTGLTVLPLVVPDLWRAQGNATALAALLAIGVLSLVLAVSLVGLQRLRERRSQPSGWMFVAAFLIPGLAGSATLVAAVDGVVSIHLVAMLVALPLGTLVAGICISASFGLAKSNRELVRDRDSAVDAVAHYRQKAESADRRAREQVAELLHGPVYGRLSACAMALNFYASDLEKSGPTQPDEVTATVLQYLTAASRDLDALAST